MVSESEIAWGTRRAIPTSFQMMLTSTGILTLPVRCCLKGKKIKFSFYSNYLKKKVVHFIDLYSYE